MTVVWRSDISNFWQRRQRLYNLNRNPSLDHTECLPIHFASEGHDLIEETLSGGFGLDVHLHSALVINPHKTLVLGWQWGLSRKKLKQTKVNLGRDLRGRLSPTRRGQWANHPDEDGEHYQRNLP